MRNFFKKMKRVIDNRKEKGDEQKWREKDEESRKDYRSFVMQMRLFELADEIEEAYIAGSHRGYVVLLDGVRLRTHKITTNKVVYTNAHDYLVGEVAVRELEKILVEIKEERK